MARLPQPGSDANQWGNILNEFLQESLYADGTLKDRVVTKEKLTTSNTAQSGQVLTWSGTNMNWTTPQNTNRQLLKAVNIYNTTTNAYPSRPSGYGSVEWIGPVDPAGAAQDYDTWVSTSEV